ncbi:hypothetical protein JB92DRAFT_2870698 [Gautieria morchelliformis]|nr:hypothetical protein JB92DRAFT_2870698 [Gautieria morchelliformis]
MSHNPTRIYHAQDVSEHQSGVLPRLREVLGDMLECPTPGPKHHYNRPYDDSFMPPSFASTSQVGMPKAKHPPIQSSASSKAEPHYPSSSYLAPTRGNFKECVAQRGCSLKEPARDERTFQSPNSPSHSYDVFLLTSEQELSHKRSSMRDDHYGVAKEVAINNSSGKYTCSECGRRFQKNSTLKNHLTTHSGERPYECPDCRRSFSVSSNMRRHLERVHRSDLLDHPPANQPKRN